MFFYNHPIVTRLRCLEFVQARQFAIDRLCLPGATVQRRGACDELHREAEQDGTMMKTTCLAALLATDSEIEKALRKLERAGLDLNATVSVLARIAAAGKVGNNSGRHSDQRPSYRRYSRRFCAFALFPNTVAGRIAVCGPMARTMLDGLYYNRAEEVPMVLANALAAAGIPEQDLGRYKTALARGHRLLLVHGEDREVERAVPLLATGREIEVAVHHGDNSPGRQGHGD